MGETVLVLEDFCKYEIVTSFDSKPRLSELSLDSSWRWLLSDSLAKSHLDQVDEALGHTIHEDDTFPAPEEIFNAFNYCKYDDLSIVILGQDPYPTRGHAHGLSFSVRTGIPIPKSLNNIYKALENDSEVEFTRPKHGCLESWARQGVLLLNSALTVKEGTAGAHLSNWMPFTDRVIQLISERKKNIIFILWGGKAKAKKKLIDTSRHTIIEFNHPSPMVRGNTFHTDCKNFSEANYYLKTYGKSEINWQL